ncbi:hypothetical protein J1605_015786 [Eschrichtius robustus]|uniref:Ubiquitin-like domain-containing protein n=1 Tax=Eschrichtius robustus TaxID=9764 RepID=A0AB34GBB0_ESCRO|nr:hypothetical protein J1605_015786 [Eschrichtius robustus]
MQLTVKALQGRECDLQVASPGPAAVPAHAVGPRAQGRAEGGDGPGGPAAPGKPGEPPSAGAAASPPASHPRPGQVSEDELVSTLKHLVSEKLNIPVRQQRLLFKGKALAAGCRGAPPGLPEAFPTTVGHSSINLSRADGKRLSDYSIGPNSKLNLVVKPLEKVLLEESSERTVAEAPPPPPAAWPLISKVLARHFSAADASRVLDQLQRDYERSLSRLTLDDIERLAGRFLHPEVTEAMEKGFSNVCFIPGLCLRIRRWLPAASTKSLDHSQQGAPSRPVA